MPDFHVAFRNLLHAVNLRHGTDGFTSPPKEGVLRIFFRPEKSDGFGRVLVGVGVQTSFPELMSVVGLEVSFVAERNEKRSS